MPSEMRRGRILAAAPSPPPATRPTRLTIDFGFGPFRRKQSHRPTTAHYAPKDLIGKLIIAVTNFPPKRIAWLPLRKSSSSAVPATGNERAGTRHPSSNPMCAKSKTERRLLTSHQPFRPPWFPTPPPPPPNLGPPYVERFS